MPTRRLAAKATCSSQVRLLTPKDLLVAVRFGRRLKQAVLGAQCARQRNVPTLGITDSHLTPVAQFCDSHLIVTLRNLLTSGSFAAPMAVISAILAGQVGLYLEPALTEPYDGEPLYLFHRWYAPAGVSAPTAPGGLRAGAVVDDAGSLGRQA